MCCLKHATADSRDSDKYDCQEDYQNGSVTYRIPQLHTTISILIRHILRGELLPVNIIGLVFSVSVHISLVVQSITWKHLSRK